MKDCIFCNIAAKKIPAETVYEDNDLVAFNDINPQAPMHAVVIPKKHIERVSDLKPEDADLAGRMILAANRIAKKTRVADSGYRIVINCNKDAGQAVFHVHIHILGGRRMNWPPG